LLLIFAWLDPPVSPHRPSEFWLNNPATLHEDAHFALQLLLQSICA